MSFKKIPGQSLTMAKLIYSAICSLDGYTADEEGDFDWAAPDKELHSLVNDLERRFGSSAVHLHHRADS
jgi:hypothetical protein